MGKLKRRAKNKDRRGRGKLTQAEVEEFLGWLRQTGSVQEACRRSKRSSRAIYELRYSNQEFAEAWDDARLAARDVLEEEAFRRAVKGLNKPVFQGGKKVGVIREYSDSLMALLLRANSRKFQERIHHTISRADLEKLSDTELAAIAEGKTDGGGYPGTA
jgi:hypothetical protein